MKKNVGDLDAYLRIAAGLSFFGAGIIRKSDMMVFGGAMKVAEGITRFCPILYMLGMNTNSKENDSNYIDIL